MTIFPDAGTTQSFENEMLEPDMVMPAQTNRKVPVQVDLVFVVDRTASSREFAAGIRQAIPMIARPVLQTHGDLECGQQPVMLVRDGQLDDVVTAIQHLRFEGGGDPPEHHTHAVETVLESVDWSGLPPRSRGAVVLFTTADSKPSPSGRSPTQIGQALAAQGVMLFAVSQLEPAVSALIDGAQGMAFAISNDPSVAEMQSIASRVAASVTDSVVQGMLQA